MYMEQRQEPQFAWYMRFILWFVALLRDTDFDFTEIQNITAKFLWGFWLLNPIWHTFANARGYAVMAQIAPEEYWGSAIMIIALLHMYALRTGNHRLRSISTLCGFMFWLLVSIMLVSANPSGTGAVVYPILTVSSLWVYVRVVALTERR